MAMAVQEIDITLSEIKWNLIRRGIGFHDFPSNRIEAPVKSFKYKGYGDPTGYQERAIQDYPEDGHLVFLKDSLDILHFSTLADLCFHFDIYKDPHPSPLSDC